MTTAREPGHRERKKQRTREALSWAALRLSVERGFGNVLVEDIAAEAGVSPRTFNNYFPSKAEAIVWRHHDRLRQITELLRERPADEPLWASINAVIVVPFADSGEPDPRWTAGVRLMLDEAELRGVMLASGAAIAAEFAVAVAERTGTDIERDLYPHLVAGAVGAAIQVASDQWLRADPPTPLVTLLGDALGQLAAGLPVPH